ncbi:MAG: phosphoglycerate mutase family protein [Rhodospirillales bacterium]|nr:phosphoglycerate mutase family protein [Rhodospirillales bacterium]
MTLFHLVRHAAHSALGRALAGTRMNVGLSDEGRAQASALADWFSKRPISAVISSPLKRTVDTARPIADRCEVELTRDSRLNEIDFGEWAGKNFDSLNARDDWKLWNAFRSGARAACGGETMVEAQARAIAAMLELRDDWPNGEVVIVSHGDIIKASLAYWLGVPLDLFRRIEISPASISQMRLDGSDVTILGVNQPTAAP